MKFKNVIFLLTILICLGLIGYIILKNNQLQNNHSNMTRNIQNDLVQLESAIDYEIKNKWKNENTVLEKVEDIKEDIDLLMDYGKRTGELTNQQEQNLSTLRRIFSDLPDYSGFPNTVLTETEKKEYEKLITNLRAAGVGMNITYEISWNYLSKAINTLASNYYANG
ncbi:hypothetical protein SAMN05216378_4516 [Paenibacillus catalpae]|uniref:Uncharacterized protein n=1 Tax=Paenibacillus catalpae TaxID=1045775 RepID=A0A1I2EV72_9BACL|nr:hypothetical protein [Paenibacillus catalpae]SFE96358.1 hypothetical protein SAMN05216378_4516 [Paenibacillus catalpae]